ncbi:peptidase M10 serralysin C terminal [Nitrosomonas sp. PY1]|uniref:M10 family metallopeptidase n=1 Tax=Nitrosomonas sp. PY1 TaxID=1803906 RepID=UPI001FC81020|nr:M10 family metallopeptidase [Nitrosomonas sp. PY1]GKS69112.1 peptidase M10 serralysin C terminal [Nitrosomonas sp. PY1]
MPTPLTSSDVTSVNFTSINTIDSLLAGKRWVNPSISYSFPDRESWWSTDENFGYGAQSGTGEPWQIETTWLTSNDQVNFERALQQWANVANVTFNKIIETANEVGDIRVAYTKDPDELTLAWSYLPGSSVRSGDIWANTLGLLNIQDWNPGTISFETILHEIGHALGLKHPFYNSDKPDAATLPTSLDSITSTLMSYTYKDLEGVEGNEFSFHPTTPMVLDIAAIQYIYGANTSLYSGNDTHHYSDTGVYHETLWDPSGIDTILYSGAAPTYIDLNPAHGSFIGQPVFVQSNGVNVGKPVPNLWIAEGAIIENAVAGTGNDILIGNGIANSLDGNLGIDTVLISGNLTQYTINKTANLSYAVVENNNATNQDQLSNIERLTFSDAKLALDLDGRAGWVAKLLGAVFGASFVSNQEYVGIGLVEADRLEYQQLADYALSAKGFTDYEKLVTTLWANLFGNMPPEAEKSFYIGMLENHEISTGNLAIIAAESAANLQNINLIGLTESGVAYI